MSKNNDIKKISLINESGLGFGLLVNFIFIVSALIGLYNIPQNIHKNKNNKPIVIILLIGLILFLGIGFAELFTYKKYSDTVTSDTKKKTYWDTTIKVFSYINLSVATLCLIFMLYILYNYFNYFYKKGSYESIV